MNEQNTTEPGLSMGDVEESTRWGHGGVLLGSWQSLVALDRRLARAQRAFSDRVSKEEGTCGFFAFITLAAPRYVSLMPLLRSQHRHLMQSLVALRVKIRRAEPSAYETLLAEADGIRDAIEEHESLEREILEDALAYRHAG